MALTKDCQWDNITIPTEYIHPAAYARAVKVDINREVDVATVNVEIYHNKEARDYAGDNKPRPIFIKVCRCAKLTTLEEGDTFEKYFGYDAMNQLDMNETKAAYAYIKSLADFVGWEDC